MLTPELLFYIRVPEKTFQFCSHSCVLSFGVLVCECTSRENIEVFERAQRILQSFKKWIPRM